MMKKLRGAVVGFGQVAARAHVPGYGAAAGFEILGVVDPAAESRAAADRLLPGVPAFADLEALFAAVPKLDFVDVATPPRFHAPLAVDLLGRNLHVLVEKPLALGRSETSDLQRAARRSGKALFTVNNWKYAPIFRRLRGLIGAGSVGEPCEIEWTILRPNAPEGAADRVWRLDPEVAGGGILMDHGWHAFYLMLFLASPRRPQAVTASLAHARQLPVEDMADVTIDFGDLSAKIHLTWAAAERRSFGLVRGSLGTIVFEDDSLAVRIEGRPEQTARFAPSLSASSYHPEWFPALLEDFRAEVLHPARRGTNLRESVACSELMVAAYESRGTAVRLAGLEEEAAPPGDREDLGDEAG